MIAFEEGGAGTGATTVAMLSLSGVNARVFPRKMMEKESNVVSILSRSPVCDKDLLVRSFFEVGSKVNSLLWKSVQTAQNGNTRCLGLFDDIRGELSEWRDICESCVKQNLIKNGTETSKALKEMFFISSHLELMFLYANKNNRQSNYYYKEIGDAAEYFDGIREKLISFLSVGS